MSKLGTRLGVEAMALYLYVPNRESLLDPIMEHVADELHADPRRPSHGLRGPRSQRSSSRACSDVRLPPVARSMLASDHVLISGLGAATQSVTTCV